jgi:hypothetical protein
VCHSEECSDEESAFDFPFLVETIGKSSKQMLHGVYPEITEGFSMTQKQTPNGPKDSFFLGALCVFAQEFFFVIFVSFVVVKFLS